MKAIRSSPSRAVPVLVLVLALTVAWSVADPRRAAAAPLPAASLQSSVYSVGNAGSPTVLWSSADRFMRVRGSVVAGVRRSRSFRDEPDLLDVRDVATGAGFLQYVECSNGLVMRIGQPALLPPFLYFAATIVGPDLNPGSTPPPGSAIDYGVCDDAARGYAVEDSGARSSAPALFRTLLDRWAPQRLTDPPMHAGQGTDRLVEDGTRALWGTEALGFSAFDGTGWTAFGASSAPPDLGASGSVADATDPSHGPQALRIVAGSRRWGFRTRFDFTRLTVLTAGPTGPVTSTSTKIEPYGQRQEPSLVGRPTPFRPCAYPRRLLIDRLASILPDASGQTVWGLSYEYARLPCASRGRILLQRNGRTHLFRSVDGGRTFARVAALPLSAPASPSVQTVRSGESYPVAPTARLVGVEDDGPIIQRDTRDPLTSPLNAPVGCAGEQSGPFYKYASGRWRRLTSC